MNRKLLVIMTAAALAACTQTRAWNNDDALACESIEMQTNPMGGSTEIEYHIEASEAPAAVHAAMKKLHPDARLTGGEKELNNGVLYYELQGVVNGMEVEAMFTPDGMLHSEELQVTADKVPDAVKKTAMGAVPGGNVTKYEEIRNAERALVEYHVKLASGKKKWKVMVSTGGDLIAVYREVPAEIEVKR